MLSIPVFFSMSIWSERNGRVRIGTIGFGVLSVRGRKRVPFPPARITAFMVCPCVLRNGRILAQPLVEGGFRKLARACHTNRSDSQMIAPDIKDLKAKIERGDASIATIGLGYVGLPLAVEFAAAGIDVVGIDIDDSKVRSVRAGESYIADVPADSVARLVGSGKLDATTDFGELGERDAIVICVPTPLSKTKDPDLSLVVRATEAIAERLRPGQLVVLESTTYPGTTEELILPTLAKSGFEVGRDFFLAFSPERVDPGNTEWNTRNTPKIIARRRRPLSSAPSKTSSAHGVSSSRVRSRRCSDGSRRAFSTS